MNAASPLVVTLYTREGCHLCDEAKAVMLPIIARHEAELRAMYNDFVPVIFIGADFFARYHVDAAKFEKALSGALRG